MKDSTTTLSNQNYILGLDIGANSVGWAVLPSKDGKPAHIQQAGIRVFEAGVDESKGTIESGGDVSRAVARREARLRRRMLERRARRLVKLGRLLQKAGLLPDGDLLSEKARHEFFLKLDKALSDGKGAMLPYFLRARALDEKLEPHEIGRALYHLAQRRGFLSGRKTPKKDEKEEGKVKEGISELWQQMKDSGARTLGEYFSRLDPQQERIRQRYTHRDMFKDEFEKIWAAQSIHHTGILTDELKKQVHRAIFYQRPLKSQRHLIGQCELEPPAKRAPIALLISQRFRLLDKVNLLEIIDTSTGEIRKLNDDERTKLADALETQGEITFGNIRKMFGLKSHARFNLETEGEKKLIGNRTAAKLRGIFGSRWDEFSQKDKDRIVEDIRSIQKDEALERRGTNVWGLKGEAAKKFGGLTFEEGYLALSKKAIVKVLPEMEKGTPYATVRKKIYGERPAPKPLHVLPALDRSPIPEVRNPAVQRALNEVRKVVNGIIRRHGKPTTIRIELARDLKKNRKDRQRISKQNQANRSAREQAAEKLLSEAGVQNPSRMDIEKWLLAEECNWICPYTGKSIKPASLFGPMPQFDIEHIIPFNRCLNNSFMNKTLCWAEENRNVKHNRTPYEAYSQDPQRWNEIIQRVNKFKGSAREEKRRRFLTRDVETLDDFASRQLNDTRYASRLAVRYLGLLYGAGADGLAEGTDDKKSRRIQAGRGQVTHFLRDEWGLNQILGDGGEKVRGDHRHHAIDAICIALTSEGTVKMLSDAAQRASRRRFAEIEPPWPGFLDDVRKIVDGVIVSHRVSRKVNRAIHKEQPCSKTHKDKDGKIWIHRRKPVESLSKTEVERIADPVVKQRVKEWLKDKKGFPYLEAKAGRKIPIHTVRIRIKEYDTTIAASQRIRKSRFIERRDSAGDVIGIYTPDSNHHVEIFETTDEKGQPKWEGEVVTTIEAMRRVKDKEPIVQRDHGPGKKFLFSLAGGEVIEIDNDDGSRGLYIIRTIWAVKQGEYEHPRLEFVHINDARLKKDILKTKDFKSAMLEPLRKKNCRKVLITPLGEVRRAND